MQKKAVHGIFYLAIKINQRGQHKHMINYISDNQKWQEFLEDYKIINGKKKRVNWESHKLSTFKLFDSYDRLGNERKAERVSKCGDYLQFKQLDDGELRLHRANFCKVRLCPMCAWRRSLKVFAQVSKIMTAFEADNPDCTYLFLTLTCRNVVADELSAQIDNLMAGFKALQKDKRFAGLALGWFRCLEVTHNLRADTYHPHYHVVFAVRETNYFLEHYMTKPKWSEMWQQCLGVDYTPVVDIRRFRASRRGAGREVAEVAKYAVKPTDYLIDGDEQRTDETVVVLDIALAHRRLVAFGGAFKRLHKLLNLDDVDDGDLVHTDIDDMRDDVGEMILHYCWHVGYKRYVLMSDD